MVYHDKNSLGQNFIKYPSLVRELIAAANITKDDLVVEIGPGKGVITTELARKVKEVRAIERDRELFEKLKIKTQNSNIKLINEDFLKWPLPEDKYKVFSNIPFSITAEIIEKLLMATNQPKEMYLIMQQEAAEKYIKNSQNAVLVYPWYEVKILGEIDRTNFTLKPQVKIIFAKFSKREKSFMVEADKKDFINFVKYGFNQWQPTISLALKKIFTYAQIKTLEKMYKIAGKKPSEVSADTWLLIYKTFKRIGTEKGWIELKGYKRD